ncbi:MAG: hypothetical protein ABI723_24585 [Bacteroidia bacterium]
MLKQTFKELTGNYTEDFILIDKLWNEIEVAYSKKKRYYHTLKHLENLLNQLNEIRKEINEWDTVLFALYYHDIVYNPLKNDNEERSAEFAAKRMKSISVPAQIINNCKSHIMATKKHLESSDNDINFFTDADLSVLGQEWNSYSDYSRQVRNEYSIYPDLVYNAGRKKVLLHFLQMKQIFKTDCFFEKFEVQAKQNLLREIGEL